ncbi:ABC transporter substrate-binding protein [Salipiger marinus]|uniref:ABC transporter substrate-binding protein n=1 Tax=Salipiger marinus TaxID=555512 RepID=UPI001E5C728B|nr:ABC transporter substrate-binding protein [Salipiger manganoxidans]
MSGFRRSFEALMLAAGLCALPPASEAAPLRVVSINLCTDQMAMLLAAPGQLLSVSHLARDPRSSAMAQQAEHWPLNHGGAEEVYLLRPDLVLAGSYTAGATVSMLERLGIPVAQFAPVTGLDDMRAHLTRMGEVLGREEQATALLAEFEAGLATLHDPAATRPRAALYFPNGYTLGGNTLGGEILEAAGFANVAAELGLTRGGVIPLELLALAAPDAVLTSQPYPGGSRSEDIMAHPVVAALRAQMPMAAVTDADWVCGTPHVLRAMEDTARLRRALEDTE